MYPARFLYDVLPANRQRAIEFIQLEVEAARRVGRNARFPVPLTRGQGGAALQFEVELGSLDQLERVRDCDGSGEDIRRPDAGVQRDPGFPPAVEFCAWTRCCVA